MTHPKTNVVFASSPNSFALPKDIRAWDAPGPSTPAAIDKNFMIRTANVLQTLLCLNNLTHARSRDAREVRVYAKLIDKKLKALSEMMRPILSKIAVLPLPVRSSAPPPPK